MIETLCVIFDMCQLRPEVLHFGDQNLKLNHGSIMFFCVGHLEELSFGFANSQGKS